MRETKSAISWIIVIIVVVVLAVIFIGLTSLGRTPNLPIKVTSSLVPLTTKENEPVKLTVSVKNLDTEFHEVELVFNTSSRIQIFAGTEQHLENNTYSFTIDDYARMPSTTLSRAS